MSNVIPRSICVESPWEISSGQAGESAAPMLPAPTQVDSKSFYRRAGLILQLS